MNLKQFYSGCVGSLYVLWILFFIPWFVLWMLCSNTTRKQFAKLKIRNQLRTDGLPPDLIKEVVKSYAKFTSLSNVRKMAKYNRVHRTKNQCDVTNSV